jgi:hypothetical protein
LHPRPRHESSLVPHGALQLPTLGFLFSRFAPKLVSLGPEIAGLGAESLGQEQAVLRFGGSAAPGGLDP